MHSKLSWGVIASCHQVTYWAVLKSCILTQKIKAFNSFLVMSLISFIQFPGGSVVKNLPAMQETWVLSLVWEDHLEKEMEIDSSILKNPIDRRAWWGCSPWGCKELLCTHKEFKCLLCLLVRNLNYILMFPFFPNLGMMLVGRSNMASTLRRVMVHSGPGMYLKLSLFFTE